MPKIWNGNNLRGKARVATGSYTHWLLSLSPYSTRNCFCVDYQIRGKSAQTTWNVHAQRKDPTPGTQRNLYSTGNGVRVCYPTQRNLHKKNEMYMADARNWRHLTQKIPTCWYPCVRWRRSAISCVRWCKSSRRQIFCVLVEYGL